MQQINRRTSMLKSHFRIVVLLYICGIFSEHFSLRTHLKGCFSSYIGKSRKPVQVVDPFFVDCMNIVLCLKKKMDNKVDVLVQLCSCRKLFHNSLPVPFSFTFPCSGKQKYFHMKKEIKITNDQFTRIMKGLKFMTESFN